MCHIVDSDGVEEKVPCWLAFVPDKTLKDGDRVS
jgi:hypothetical protein